MNLSPITFLGIAEHIEETQPFCRDVFQLSYGKAHLFFPASTEHYLYVFVISKELLLRDGVENIAEIQIIDSDGKQFGHCKIANTNQDEIESSSETIQAESMQSGLSDPSLGIYFPDLPGLNYAIFYIQFNIVFDKPATYTVQAKWDEEYETVGTFILAFSKTPPFSPEQIKAIESNPSSIRAVRILLGCKHCDKEVEIYSALSRISEVEKEGALYQYEVPDEFICNCKSTHYSLEYIKEGLHGLLLKLRGEDSKTLGLSFQRRYGHSRILEIAKAYNKLLDKEDDEKPFQEFIEKNPVLLACFAAKKLFIKPRILGLFAADFGILDTSNRLILIELERPALKLFKTKDGHMTANLHHAYEQVKDWLRKYQQFPQAVLDGLMLKPHEVSTVKGIVIAGRSSKEKFDHIQRHLSMPPYPDIEFYTLEDLSRILVEISKNLA
jgi:hypothetical protein